MCVRHLLDIYRRLGGGGGIPRPCPQPPLNPVCGEHEKERLQEHSSNTTRTRVRNGGSLTSLVVKISVTHRRENVISLPTAASDGGQDEQMKNAKCSCRQRDRVAAGVCVLGLVVAQAANYKPLRRSASVALAASLCATRKGCAQIVRFGEIREARSTERPGEEEETGKNLAHHTLPSRSCVHEETAAGRPVKLRDSSRADGTDCSTQHSMCYSCHRQV